MTKSTLSNTARATLAAAVARDDRVALPPEHLPAAAQRAVVQSLLKAGLLEEVATDDDELAWRTTEVGLHLALRVTDAGLHAINTDPLASARPRRQKPPRPSPSRPRRPVGHRTRRCRSKPPKTFLHGRRIPP